MPRVTVPAGSDPLMYVWGELAPQLSAPAAAYSDAVYSRSSLSLREFEAARFTLARINDCAICRGWRSGRDVPARAEAGEDVPEEFYERLDGPLDWDGFTERERLAAEFSARYATDHLGLDDELWARLHGAFSDAELVDLALCVASWLALGRFNRVFDIDGACRVGIPLG
jgi:alkylhydroperoxidase family enzyme